MAGLLNATRARGVHVSSVPAAQIALPAFGAVAPAQAIGDGTLMLPEFRESHAHAREDGAPPPAPSRRARTLVLQRERRHRLRRIDFYPSESVAALIDRLRKPGIGNDASGIINRIITEWASASGLRSAVRAREAVKLATD